MTALSYTLISFPGLGLELDPPSTIQLGPLTIHFYGLIIAVGMLLAVLYASKRSKEFGLKEDDLIDGVLWVAPFAIICARLYYCIFEWDQYASNPISILYIWNGGLAIYGGVLGAVIGLSVFCKVRKIKATAMMDVVSLGLLIGQLVGRWGNFMNREAFGAPTDSFLRMGLYNTATGAVEYYHPTFLYESLWNFVGFLLLHFLSKKRKYDGQVALGYVAWYGLGRAFIEGLRMDSLYWGPFRVSQVLAGIICVAAVAVLLWHGFRPHDPAKMLANQAKEAKSEEAPKTEDETHENEG